MRIKPIRSHSAERHFQSLKDKTGGKAMVTGTRTRDTAIRSWASKAVRS